MTGKLVPNPYLVLSTENVGIILLELADTGKSAESAGGLVTVQDTKIRDSQRKLTITTVTVTKEHEVTRAVHGLQRPLSLLDVQLEHVVLVVRPVAGSLPDTNIIHVGGLDLLVATLAIL